MTVRVRWTGLVALWALAAAGLLPSVPMASDHLPTVQPNLALVSSTVRFVSSAPIDAWAVEGRSAKTWTLAERRPFAFRRQFPDGIRVMTLTAKIGAGRPTPVLTNAVTPQQLLTALDVTLGERDLVHPSATATLYLGMRFRVVRVRKVVETVRVAVPYRTLIQHSKDLTVGQSEVLTAGHPGTELRTYRVTYRNGREVARVLVISDVLEDPVTQVLLEGTAAGSDHGSQTGQASWYECPDEGNFAAHLTLPKGTVVTVTNLDNGETVTVVINDRGPYGVQGRIIDLCSAAFAQIAPLGQGVADVTITW